MIRFFRKLRQKVISEGNIEKYLKYALGEIVLVVFGILIALQINNWNECRISNKQEQQLLRQLKEDIKSNLDEVTDISRRLQINKTGVDSLLSRIDKKQYDLMVPIYLFQTLRKSDFNKASSGYNLIQNGKATLISDENILKAVLNIYENDLPNILNRQKDMIDDIEFINRQFVNKYFYKAPNKMRIQLNDLDIVPSDLFEPVNFETLSNNIEFENILIGLGTSIEIRLAYLKKTEEKLHNAFSMIDRAFSDS